MTGLMLQYGVNLTRPNDKNFNWRQTHAADCKEIQGRFPAVRCDDCLLAADRAFSVQPEYKICCGIDSLIKIQATLVGETGCAFL